MHISVKLLRKKCVVREEDIEMWLGMIFTNDGFAPEFKRAKTKKEIVKWLEENGFNEGFEETIYQEDGISHQITQQEFNTGMVINLKANKK